MKILAFSPQDLSTPGGNASTLLRLRRGLAARGHVFEILPVPADARVERLRDAAEAARPDLLHFYHAWKTGRFLPGLAGRPRVLTIAGTDLNADWNDPARRPAIDAALAAAEAVVTYGRSLAARVPKARLIPKGVELGTEPFDLRGAADVGPGEILFLQAGGIRPVKNNLLALRALHGTGTRLVFLGPVLDAAYGRELERALTPEARLLPPVSPGSMAAAYAAADVVLNTSLSEGLSNALMEAMAAGRAILASDVAGNRDLLRDGVDGLFHKDEEELRAKALRLAGSPGERRDLGEAARAAAAAFSVEAEVDALLDAYLEAL